jgi:hypothetical protein
MLNNMYRLRLFLEIWAQYELKRLADFVLDSHGHMQRSSLYISNQFDGKRIESSHAMAVVDHWGTQEFLSI